MDKHCLKRIVWTCVCGHNNKEDIGEDNAFWPTECKKCGQHFEFDFDFMKGNNVIDWDKKAKRIEDNKIKKDRYYIRAGRTWYRDDEDKDGICIMKTDNPYQGIKYEFKIIGHDFGRQGKAVQACIFDDAFDAIEYFGDLFKLIQERKVETLDEVEAICRELNIKDNTEEKEK